MDAEIVERLDRVKDACGRLGRANRRLRAGLATLAAGSAVLLLAGGAWRPDPPEVIEARQVLLRDGEGRVRADLNVDRRGNVALFLKDAEGNNGLSLGVTPDGRPALGLTRAATRQQIALAFDPLGSAGLSLYDESLTRRVWISTAKDGTPSLQLRDGRNQVVYEAPPIERD